MIETELAERLSQNNTAVCQANWHRHRELATRDKNPVFTEVKNEEG
jgi:hypothetical protein